MKWVYIIIVIGVLAASCTNNSVEDNLSDGLNSNVAYTNITSQKLSNMIKSGENIFLVDTHIPEQAHILGTDAFIPFDQIENNVNKLPKKKDLVIVLYCRSGRMSEIASEKLTAIGYTKVYNLISGTNGWKEAGFPFVE